MESVEDVLALIDGDSRTVVFDDEADAFAGQRLDEHANQPAGRSGVLDRVGDQVAQRLRETVRVGAERAIRNLSELEAPVGQQAHAIPQLRTYPDRSIHSIRRNSVCSVLASSSRSSTSRMIRAISACTRRSTRRTSSLEGLILRGEHFELPANDRQRGAQLVRGVRDKRPLTGESVGQAIEHVVERVGQHLDLVALTARVVDAMVQVAGVHPRCHGGHLAQRARHARADQVGGEQRAGERQESGEDEGAGDPPLGLRDARQRLPHADRDLASAGYAQLALEQPQLPDVGQRERRIAGRSAAQPTGCPVLERLLGGALAVVRGVVARTAQGGWCAAPGPGRARTAASSCG